MEYAAIARAESPAFLESVLQASTEYSIIAADRAGKVLLWNEGARRIYGYAPEEVLGRHTRLLTAPGGPTMGLFDDVLATTLAKGRWEGVLARRHKSGQTFPTRVVCTVLKFRRGPPRGFLIVSQDLSTEPPSPRSYIRTAERDHELIEAGVDAMMTTDTAGIITDVNRQVEKITGRTHAQLVGTPLKDYFAEPGLAEAGVRRVLIEDRVTEVELSLLPANGLPMPIALNARSLRGPDGKLRGVVAAVRDISEQSVRRAQLENRNRELEIQSRIDREASRLKSEFLAGMSHELRTPLDSIIGCSDHLLSTEAPSFNAEQQEFLRDILNSGNHLLQLINDLLDLARIESGKLELSPVAFSPQKALDEIRSLVKTLVAEKELTITVQIAPEVETVVLDPLRFKQIVYNLLSNAIKFSKRRGRIRIRLAPYGERGFSMSVADSGIGIAAKELPRLFREFERLEAGRNRQTRPGTGLGLSLTDKLVRHLGGSIDVESALGKGSTFTVFLPATLPEPVALRIPRTRRVPR